MEARQVMGIEEFGAALIMTRDLDPCYVALHDARLERDQLYRWLLAYWCFYHMGAASYLSEYQGRSFWERMEDAAENIVPPNHAEHKRWPRASERRYFRGEKCVKAVQWLWGRWPTPEDAVEHVIGTSFDIGKLRTERKVMEVIGEWPLFGPWIGFKAADMLERCAGVQVEFRPDTGLIYASPLAGLAAVMETRGGTVEGIYADLLEFFGATRAPPALDRGCGPQELETVSCKYHSYLQGRYWVGKDILEVRHALAGWGATADRLLATAPVEVER